MHSQVIRLLPLLGLVAVIGLPVVLAPRERASTEDAALPLVIITPHNEGIRHEIGRAFAEWHRRCFGQAVRIDWRVIGGSSDVLRLLTSQYQALAAAGREEEGAGYDVVFGGGDYLFDKKLKKGVTVTGPDGRPRQVSITRPIEIEEEIRRAVYPEPALAGQPLYDPEGHWWGVVLTSFGIVYNRQVTAALGLPEPAVWKDLAEPRYFRWIGLTDPAHSGSVLVTYDAIMGRLGWDEGWSTLRRICANARYFAWSSSQVPVDASIGETAAGMSIDFYGRFQAQVVGGDRLAYVAPVGQTVVNADPVAVLRGAPNRRTAERFVRFLLTEEAQLLWNLPIGDPQGPRRFELRRSPIRPDLYTRHLDRMVDRENPYEVARPMPAGTPSYFDVLPVVLHAMAIDVHEDLARAWRAICTARNPRTVGEMLRLFDELPFTPQELQQAPRRWKENPRARTDDRLAWTGFFLDRYRRIAAMGGARPSMTSATGEASTGGAITSGKSRRGVCRASSTPR